jgi:hypothetical protein
MDCRSLAVRLAAVVAPFLPAVWLAASGSGALAAAAASTAAAAPAGSASVSAIGVQNPPAPASIRQVGLIAAPWVPDSGPLSGTKTGLAAPAMSSAMIRANAEKQAMARAFLTRMALSAGPAADCAKQPCGTGLPGARDLEPTQRMQRTNYFCGPAAVSEMLAQMGVIVHQRKAARELGTTQNGTDWSDSSGYPVPAVLNENQSINDYVAVALPWVPSRSQLGIYEADLVTDINHGRGAPLAGNAYEVPGGPHLVGHPVSQTIFHWFDIRGYQNSGATTDYEDSVHGASSIGWSASVPAYSSLASAVIVDIIGARGYDW